MCFSGQIAQKSILKNARTGAAAQSNLAQQVKQLTRGVVVRLERIDHSKLNHSAHVAPHDQLPQQETLESAAASKENSPQQNVPSNIDASNNQVSTQQPVDTSNPLQFCEDCAESFEMIFDQKRQAYNAPYNDMLLHEVQVNTNVGKQLEEIDNRWNEEIQKWNRLSNQLDKAHDKMAALFQKNMDLRHRVQSVTAIVLHDHNYAKSHK